MGGISGIEAVVTKALVLGDSNASFLERIVRIIKGGKVEAEAALARTEEGVGGDDGARHRSLMSPLHLPLGHTR